MNVTQISIGRFHHFHLARQLEKRGMLNALWTGYPKFKLKDEQGIDPDKIKTFPWLHATYMMRGKIGLNRSAWLNREWAWHAHETLDKHVSTRLNNPTVLIALSGGGLISGTEAQKKGGKYICDRGSSHIRYQDQILTEEYKRWGLKFKGVDPRVIDKEEAEYKQADLITVPSQFVLNSFLQMGVPAEKISKVVYGARLDRFKKVADSSTDKFQILWVGGVSIRKGFLDLLHAFQEFKHPNKEMLVIGAVAQELKPLLHGEDLSHVVFKGVVSNSELPLIYSKATVFVLPSIEEGLAMVQGEALACGCPVIATTNTGSEDLFTDGVEGLVIPIRSPKLITEKLQFLADNPIIQGEMSAAALKRVQALGGWDSYGDSMVNAISTLT